MNLQTDPLAVAVRKSVDPVAARSESSLQTAEEFREARPLRRVEEISRMIDSLVASWQTPVTIQQRRRWHRMKYTRLLLMTPLDTVTEEICGEPQIVTGRDISPGGISFSHREPMPYRKTILTFVLTDGDVESAVTKLTWCRFTRDGWYQSGGMFLRRTKCPIEGEIDWEALEWA